jgi:alkylhydroperoxidase/carboxymuconolactone decarboxylase family protein YurZ
MPIKTALLTAFSIVMLQLPSAGFSSAQSRDHTASITVTDPEITGALPAKAAAIALPEAKPLHPGQSAAGDIVGARGPNPHARELTQIAIYASVGNADGVAMLTSQLRERGVSREAIRRAINQTNVHGDAFVAPAPRLGRSSSHADAGWQATQ